MNYVDSLEVELAAAGIPARRRARIVAEFSDHLHENPEAELGAPRDLARQFADELGTRLARGTAKSRRRSYRRSSTRSLGPSRACV
jgi:hypothetical protein